MYYIERNFRNQEHKRRKTVIRVELVNQLTMKVTRYQDQEIKQNPHGVDVRELYNKESAQAMHLILQPGQSLKPHITPVDVFFFVIEGTPTIHVGDKKQMVEKDNLIECPAELIHCISNESNNVARVLVVKAPRPVKATKVL